MAKLKTNSGAKKRFTLTGSGKIKRKHAYHSHILTKKTKKQKRNLEGLEPENVDQGHDHYCEEYGVHPVKNPVQDLAFSAKFLPPAHLKPLIILQN